jgi:uroporphyrinogen decarboxylase
MHQVMAGHRELAIHREQTVRREDYLDIMTFKRPGTALFKEIFGPLVGLRDEWKAQGATADELSWKAFPFRQAFTSGLPIHTGWRGPDDSEMIEDNAEQIVYRDNRGIKQKIFKRSSTLPLPLEHPVEDKATWDKVKVRYADDPERTSRLDAKLVEEKRAQGCVITASIPGAYDEIRVLCGDELAAVLPYEEPELLQEMLETIFDTAYAVIDRATRLCPIDMLVTHEDMAGKGGPMWGPRQVDEFLRPHYRRIWDLVRSRGARLFFIDSDGDCRPIMKNFIDAGINLFSPCEPAAGMDVAQLRKEYGSAMAFEGGINKYELMKDLAAIDRELEAKLPPLIKTGGFTIGLDHRVPAGTPLANYRHYIARVWEILRREGAI